MSIELLQCISPDWPHFTFSEVVFHERELAFSMQCRECMIVKTPMGEFIALDRLLSLSHAQGISVASVFAGGKNSS